MIELAQGNLLEAPAEALVNSVNTVGVMGKGLALQFKRAYPRNFVEYEAACKRGEVEVGAVFVHETAQLHPRWILNVPTKRHWRQPSRLDDVRQGLAALVEVVRRRGIRSIAVPPLGCGAGGLSWSVVRPLIETAFAPLEHVHVYLYEPGQTPVAKAMPNRTSRPAMTPGRAAIVALAGAYLDQGLALSLTTLEIQKLAYFMQVDGEQLRLRYTAHHYGPYADALRKVLEVMEGHFITGLGDDATKPDIEIELLPGAREEAERALKTAIATRQHIARVIDLIEGFEDPYGLELLASTHWVMTHQPNAARDRAKATAAVASWSARKASLFHPEHVSVAWARLRSKHWVGGTDHAATESAP
jgi:O-acetyl-ADP-ribose deacetylase (regulator of RNase III)